MRVDIESEQTAVVNNLTHEGRGVASVNGKKTFISGALAGEKVTYTVTKKRSSFDEANVEQIIEAAATRVKPQCQHFGFGKGNCGGCGLQHLNHQQQIEFKQQTMLQQLSQFAKVKPQQVLPPLVGPIWNYRHKARLGVRYVAKKNKVLVGFRERQNSFLADLSSCEILVKEAAALIEPLQQLIAGLSVFKDIPQIEVAKDDTKLALVFRHLQPLTAEDLQQLQQFAKQHQIYLYLQSKGYDSVELLYPQQQVLPLSYSLPQYDLTFNFHPLDFTQVNMELNRFMVAQALSLLNPQADETVFDLFCGLGNFSLPLARFAKMVIAVEGSDTMVKTATANAALNGIENAKFYAADLSKDCALAPWMQYQCDKLLLDPPRSGAAAVLPLLSILKPKTIVYVSCNPATFAADAAVITREYGYVLEKAGIIDMFPHTNHVESMGLFVRN